MRRLFELHIAIVVFKDGDRDGAWERMFPRGSSATRRMMTPVESGDGDPRQGMIMCDASRSTGCPISD